MTQQNLHTSSTWGVEEDIIQDNFTDLYINKVPYIGAIDTLNLMAGTATKAPIKFTSGTHNSPVQPGTLEYDGTRFYGTPVGHRRIINMSSDSMIATATATAITPVVLWTGIINAGEPKVNRVYMVKGCGLFTTNDAIDQVTISIKFGGITICDVVTPANIVTNKPFTFESFLTIRSLGVTGTISSCGQMEASGGNRWEVNDSITINTTIINNIELIAQWSDTSNSISLTQCWLSIFD